MRMRNVVLLVLLGLMPVWTPLAAGDGRPQDKPKVQIPESGVPEVMTMEGKFVRAAYNNEGYAILGYQASNRSIGDEWMMLEFGVTLRDGVPDYTFKRDALSLELPDGTTLPLPTIMEHREGNTRAIENRAKVQRDSINYFPPNASQACGIVFFPALDSRALPRDEIELTDMRACLGRLFFKIPGGIKHGQYWLNVKFATEPGTRAVPDPHGGRREAAVEELQGHQQTGEGRLQEEVGLGGRPLAATPLFRSNPSKSGGAGRPPARSSSVESQQVAHYESLPITQTGHR